MEIRFNDGVKDVALTEVNKDNYIVPENEKHLYHCKLEMVKFDSSTGKRLSAPRIQKFGQKVYESTIIPSLKRQGYTIELLYSPTAYLAQIEEQKKESAALMQRKKDEALQAKIDAAVEAALKAQAEAHQKEIEDAVAKAMAKKK